ncbi:MAG: hypothetical protein ABEJ93_02480 [Candidatus Nanohalobium sp.]
MSRSLFELGALLAGLCLMVSVAAAQKEAGAASVESKESFGPFQPSGPDSESLRAGEILNANLSANQPTSSWAGLFGEATGNLILGNGSNRLYEWSSDARYVYATNTDIDFGGNWSSTTVSDLESEYSFVENGSDRAAVTFDSTANISSFTQDSKVIGTVAAETLNGSGSEVWTTAFVADNTTNPNYFFAGEVSTDSSRTFWNGENVQESGYQMILPEDNGNTAEYSLYIELD